TFVLNDPHGLREANEKLYALRFPDLVPESLVSAEPARLKAFMESLGGEMIVKPLDGCGGAGVFHLHRADRNLNAILELSTRDATRLVMAQRYLPAVREEGDKRLIVLAGEPLGAVRRIPRDDEHRGNIHVGGRVERAPVDARDREICRRMADRLMADGLYFVGLDVIGGLLTEVNVTSPTGVQEIDRLDGVCLEAHVLDFVEARAATLDRRASAAPFRTLAAMAGTKAAGGRPSSLARLVGRRGKNAGAKRQDLGPPDADLAPLLDRPEHAALDQPAHRGVPTAEHLADLLDGDRRGRRCFGPGDAAREIIGAQVDAGRDSGQEIHGPHGKRRPLLARRPPPIPRHSASPAPRAA